MKWQPCISLFFLKKNRIYQCFWCLVPKVKFIYLQRQNYSPKIIGSVANSRLKNQTQVLYLCFANIYILTNLPCCKCWKNVSSSSHINFLSICHFFFFILHFFSFSFLFLWLILILRQILSSMSREIIRSS